LRGWLRSAEKLSHVLLALGPALEDATVADTAMSNAAILLEILQTAIEEQPQIPIWVVTRGGAAVEYGDDIDLSASCVDAMAKTARLEHPALSIHWVDLPSQPTEADIARLSQLIREGTREHALALRQGMLFAPRLVPLAKVSARDLQPWGLTPNGAFMVTGGYGGLGFRTVQWMTDRGAKCIVIVGRHEPSPEQREQISRWREHGIRIYDLVADISERRDVEKIFNCISGAGIDLRGIIQSAGTLDDGTILQQSSERLASVFAAKVHGSWLLHEFSRGLPLDFFVLFGSAASILGSPGQGNHAAANGFLDALSHFRHREGLQATTVAWGAWSSVGAATRVKDTGRAMRMGFNAVSPEKGIELLEQAISSRLPCVAVLPIDWKTYLGPGQPQRKWPFFAEFSATPVDRKSLAVRVGVLKSTLDAAPAETCLSVIKDHLRTQILDILHMDSHFALLDDRPLAELGLDSLMALELKNGLQQELEIALPANFFFEYPTLEMAATFVSAKLVVTRHVTPLESDSSDYEELAL